MKALHSYPSFLFKLLVCGILLPVFGASDLFARQEPAPVHFVYGSDTSTPGINVKDRSNLYHNSAFELFSSPQRNAFRVMNEAYRSQFKDSFGNPLKLTWWMQGGSLYQYAENTNLPFGSTMSLYLMNKYHGKTAEELGDEMTYHYHTWAWSDANGDGRFYWNQAFSFEEVREDFDLSLAQHFLEENMFPVSFRSGWHYMDNAWQQHLNQWVPFSLHNNSPYKTEPGEEPIGIVKDWSRATLDFIPFRPKNNDYQSGGGSGGWNTRSRYFLRLTESDLRRIFEQARAGSTQVACIWGHLAAASFVENMEVSLNLIYKIAAEYPDVPFHFSTAVEAMQDWLQTADTTAPVIQYETLPSGDEFRIQVSTDEPIFQSVPFVAAKNIYEEHFIVPMEPSGPLTWQSVGTLNSSDIAKWGVAVTDSSGNQSKEMIRLLPDDIYLDNDDSVFQTGGSGWQSGSAPGVNHYWGKTIQKAQAEGQSEIQATWYGEAKGNDPLQVFYRMPEIDNPVDSLSLEVYLGGEQVLSTTLNDLSGGEWIYAGIIQPILAQEIKVTISAGAQGGKSLVADVIKLSPLIRKKQLNLKRGNYSFGEREAGKDHMISIELSNSGSEALFIEDINTSSGVLTALSSLPMRISPYSSETLWLRLHSEFGRRVRDTLTVFSNDDRHPENGKEFTVSFRDEFEIIDNDYLSGYVEYGDWRTSVTQAYGSSSRFAIIQNGSNPSVTYSMEMEKAGYYEAAYIVPEAENSALRADYSIYKNNALIKTIRFNQNTGSGNWISLGAYNFNPGDTLHVNIQTPDADQPSKVLRADALRVSYIGEALSHLILDNEGEFYEETGHWNTSNTQGYGESSRYSYGGGDATASYFYMAPVTSPYIISILLPHTENASREARYHIYQNDELLDYTVINQNSNSGNWRALGSWSFQQGDSLSISLTNVEEDNSNRVLRADALRLSYFDATATSSEKQNPSIRYQLKQNYPNPFNPSTNIEYSLAGNSFVQLEVFDLLGRKVATLVNQKQVSGHYHVQFNAGGLSSGVYLYRLKTDNYIQTRKFTLIK